MPESYEPGQYEYHYKREERIAGQSKWLKDFYKKQPFFQRHRNMIIIFVDIVFIMIVFLVFSPFANIGTPKIGEYRIKTKGLYFEDEILVSVEAVPGKMAPGKTQDILLELNTGKTEDGGGVVTRGVLNGEGSRIFRMSLKDAEKPEYVYVRTVIGDDERVIKVSVDEM